MKRKNTLILFCIILFSCNSFSQNMDLWYKLSPEIRVTFAKNNWEFRLRPTDYVLPHKTLRTDFMFGYKIKSFKIFSYSKFDNKDRAWSGLRVDFNKMGFNNRAAFQLQGRLFLGLNNNSKDHYYHVQYFDYDLNKTFGIGALGYGQTNFGELPLWFIGPSATMNLNKTFQFHFSLMEDVFRSNLYLWFIRLNVKIKIRGNS